NEEINSSAIRHTDGSTLDTFIAEIRIDYENAEKFIERYHASKSISIAQLTSFLYNVNNVNSTRVKSGAMIHVQVESVK
ncbi:4148_t:CDS:2, partial [Cetraspora pellucida]